MTVTTPKPKILFVEDDPVFTYAVRRFFGGKDYDVLTATGVREAVELFKRNDVDIVVTDVRFANDEPDGLELTSLLKQKRPTFPVICLTAYPEAVDTNRPALDVIVMQKPVDLPTLQDAIDALAS
jgi:CheY-like chemotaxis protein